MKIEAQTSPEAVITELGARIAHRRIELGMSQAEMAKQAGIGKRTIERIESGEDTQLTTLIRLLRILELTDRLDTRSKSYSNRKAKAATTATATTGYF